MKTMFCEHCPVIGDDCIVCESMRWEDDGGRVIDHDAPTTPAETLPETAALVWEHLQAIEDESPGWGWYAVVFGGAVLWAGALVFALGKHAKWW